MRSDNAKAGMQQAPARSLFRALGLTEEEMARPLIGVVNSYNEMLYGSLWKKAEGRGTARKDRATVPMPRSTFQLHWQRLWRLSGFQR